MPQQAATTRPARRNGVYYRHLLTELGDIEIAVPRTRRFSPCEVLRAYAQATPRRWIG